MIPCEALLFIQPATLLLLWAIKNYFNFYCLPSVFGKFFSRFENGIGNKGRRYAVPLKWAQANGHVWNIIEIIHGRRSQFSQFYSIFLFLFFHSTWNIRRFSEKVNGTSQGGIYSGPRVGFPSLPNVTGTKILVEIKTFITVLPMYFIFGSPSNSVSV